MLIDLLRAYKKSDPAARNIVEVLLFYPGVKATFFHRIAHALFMMRIPLLPRAISEFSRFISGIEIHPGARLGKAVVIDHGMGTVIGETAVIGNNVLIYQGVTLGGTSLARKQRHPTVGDRVVIGAGAKVLGNIRIGCDSRIGANSVVVTDVPEGSTVVGIPGQVIDRPVTPGCELDHDFII